MLAVAQNFYERAMDIYATPFKLLILTTVMGQYAISDVAPGDEMITLAGIKIADGSYLADGSATAGAGTMPLLGAGDWVIKWGTISEQFAGLSGVLLGSVRRDRLTEYSVTLDNHEGLFSRIKAEQRLVGSTLELRLGYGGLAGHEWITRFTGRVYKAKVSRTDCVLYLRSSGADDWVDELYALRRAGDYANPRDEGALIPAVLGDMTQGSVKGQWVAPCIDTTDPYVYAVAGHAVLSEGSGNSVSVYDKDGAAISSGWTFNEADNYEGRGAIATLTFAADQEAKEPLTVCCKGAVDAGASLITNPISQANHFITTLCGQGEDTIHTPSLQQAIAACSAASYEAAGIIDADISRGEFLSSLLSDFIGSWWNDADNLLRVSIDIDGGGWLEDQTAGSIQAYQCHDASDDEDEANLTNQVALSWARNAATNEYHGSDDGVDSRRTSSIRLYGLKPLELQLNWVRSSAVATAIRVALLDAYAHPPRVITVPLDGLGMAYVERGDHLLLSSDWIYDETGQNLTNQVMRVQAIALDLAQDMTTLTLKDTGFYRTIAYLADGTHTADGSIIAGGERDMTPR